MVHSDGGSGLWTDLDNVFNHIDTSSVFCHGGSGGITVDGIYMNDSGLPNLQGATNMKLHDEKGVCIMPNVSTLAAGEDWSGSAAEVVAQAGRRTAAVDSLLPTLTTPPTLTPPVNDSKDNAYMADLCVRFAALPCVEGKLATPYNRDYAAKGWLGMRHVSISIRASVAPHYTLTSLSLYLSSSL